MSIAEVSQPPSSLSSSSTFPNERPQTLRLRRTRPRNDLCASLGDGAAFSAMVGIGETYFAAFALALGTSETIAGLIAALPMLAGAGLQLGTPWFLRRTHSYKHWVVLCASLQATALLIMPIAAWFTGRAATAWIMLSAACYWAAVQATAPAWNTWIEEIVPRRLRANFFASRSRFCQLATLAGFVLGAMALEIGKSSAWLLTAFTLIFLTGSACRFLSAWFLSRQSEPSRGRYRPRPVPLREVFIRQRGERGVPLVLYLLAVQTAVQISGPFFAPYMLGHQRLSYVSFMFLVGLGYFGKVLALPLWGRIAHAAGARRLLWIGGTSIVPVAALWLAADWFAPLATTFTIQLGSLTVPCHLSAEMAYLACVQLLSGFVWAAYELAMMLMFFEAIPRSDRASVITWYNFGNAAALVAGGLIGAAILQLGRESHAAYMVVFAGSSLVRLATVPLLRQIASPESSRVHERSEMHLPGLRRKAA